jgi:purine-nucleoside phosphorylase
VTGNVTPTPGESRGKEPAAALRRVSDWLDDFKPRTAIVLGSGLGSLVVAVERPKRLAYSDIPGFPVPQVAGHGGELVAGLIEGVPVLLQSGRFHLYEGHEPQTVALPVRIFADLGIRVLIVTNAAGGLRPGFRPPVLMLITDQVNLAWRNPLAGPLMAGEQRFPDMSHPFDPGLRTTAREVALEARIPLEEGVYAGLLGPQYETPAEIRMYQRLGADAVGMSTVSEVIVAGARGMRVLGFSTITNLGTGMTAAKLSHEEVLVAGKQVADQLEVLVRGVLRKADSRIAG